MAAAVATVTSCITTLWGVRANVLCAALPLPSLPSLRTHSQKAHWIRIIRAVCAEVAVDAGWVSGPRHAGLSTAAQHHQRQEGLDSPDAICRRPPTSGIMGPRRRPQHIHCKRCGGGGGPALPPLPLPWPAPSHFHTLEGGSWPLPDRQHPSWLRSLLRAPQLLPTCWRAKCWLLFHAPLHPALEHGRGHSLFLPRTSWAAQ
jgi:hypothetical protein